MVEYTAYNGTITVEEDAVVITHHGVVAKTSGRATNTPRRLPLAAVSGVRIKPATLLENGWLSLGIGGGDAPELSGGAVANCPDAVMFRRKDSAKFQALYSWLESVVELNRTSGVEQSAIEVTSAVDTRLQRLERTPEEHQEPTPVRQPQPAASTPVPVSKIYGKRPPAKYPALAEVVAAATLEAPRYPLDEQIEVAGETHHIKGIKRVFAEVGSVITARGTTLEELQCVFVPEPWNPHDSNAVAVMVGQHHVGYVPSELAEDYAEPLRRLAVIGTLTTGEARIWAKAEGAIIRARVTVLAPEPHALA